MMILEQFIVRGDNDETVYTPWMRCRGNSARFFIKLIAGSVTNGNFQWTVETKKAEDVDGSADVVVTETDIAGLPAIKEAVPTSGMKELFRYTVGFADTADEGSYMFYQLMDPIWQPTYD